MRLPSIVTIAIVLAAPTLTHADSILVGTDLSNTQTGPELCPLTNDCNVRVSQFTLLTPVVVDDVKVAISGPIFEPSSNGGSFGVNLFNQLQTIDGLTFPITTGNIGAGNLVFDPTTFPPVTQVFDFGGLDITLGPGTYYLQVEGANLAWNSASPLATSAGTLGLQLSCAVDSGQCASHISYDTFPGTYAMQISGTVTPEPSSWVLFGTGILGFASVARRKFLAIS
jgi:hypothetical protein